MADYPDEIFTPRAVVNLPGEVYDPDKTQRLYAEDINNPNAEIVAIEEELGVNAKGAYSSVKAWLTALASAISVIVSSQWVSTTLDRIYYIAGNVGIGTTTPDHLLTVAKDGDVRIVVSRASGDTGPGQFLFRKSRGSHASPADVQNGDELGRLTFNGFSGSSAFLATAFIAAEVAGTFTTGQRPPSRLVFYTNVANGAQTERLRIDSSGRVGIATAGDPTAFLDINSDIFRLRTSKTPSSSSASGNAGDFCWDSNYIYICISTNTWRRIAHATW